MKTNRPRENYRRPDWRSEAGNYWCQGRERHRHRLPQAPQPTLTGLRRPHDLRAAAYRHSSKLSFRGRAGRHGISVHGNLSSAKARCNPSHGPCPIRRCRPGSRALLSGTREACENPAFQVIFQCKIARRRPRSKTLSHCKNTVSGSRCAARRTTRWSAARANTPTTSPCPARPMPGWSAPATPTAIIKGIDTAAAKAMPGVLGVWTGARSRGGRLQPLHLRPAAEEPRRLAAAADQPSRARNRQGALRRRPRCLRGCGNAGAGARCRRRPSSSTSSRCPP